MDATTFVTVSALMRHGEMIDPAELAAPRPSWQSHGACAGGDNVALFFIERGGDMAPAKAPVCQVFGIEHLPRVRDGGSGSPWLLGRHERT